MMPEHDLSQAIRYLRARSLMGTCDEPITIAALIRHLETYPPTSDVRLTIVDRNGAGWYLCEMVARVGDQTELVFQQWVESITPACER